MIHLTLCLQALNNWVRLSSHLPTLDGISLTSNTSIKNLGVIINQDLLLDSHIKQISKTLLFHLRNIAKIRKVLSLQDAEKRIHACITSRLDYCNSLLSGCSNNSIQSLQLIQNAAACTLTRTKKYEHISPVLLCIGSLSNVQLISKCSF